LRKLKAVLSSPGRTEQVILGGYLCEREKREAISLAPRLQPGGQVIQNGFLNRFQRFLLRTKPLETVPWQLQFVITGLKPRC